jgi:hypothetical protein
MKNEILYRLSIENGESLAPQGTFIEVGQLETVIRAGIHIAPGVSRLRNAIQAPHLTIANAFIKMTPQNWIEATGDETPAYGIQIAQKDIPNILEILAKYGSDYVKEIGMLSGEFTEDTRKIRVRGFGKSGYDVGIDFDPLEQNIEISLIPLIKWEILELIKMGKVFCKCPNCGDYYTKRYRQHSQHCNRCTNISRLTKAELSEPEQQKRRAAKREAMKNYRASLKKPRKVRSRPRIIRN